MRNRICRRKRNFGRLFKKKKVLQKAFEVLETRKFNASLLHACSFIFCDILFFLQIGFVVDIVFL